MKTMYIFSTLCTLFAVYAVRYIPSVMCVDVFSWIIDVRSGFVSGARPLLAIDCNRVQPGSIFRDFWMLVCWKAVHAVAVVLNCSAL